VGCLDGGRQVGGGPDQEGGLGGRGARRAGKTSRSETARDAYRFELKVLAGHNATQTVAEERDLGSTLLLTNSPDEQVRVFLQSPVVSDKVKAGLQKAQELRWEWAGAQREVGEQQGQLQTITEDQARLRANLREVPQSSPLPKYGRTVCADRVAVFKAVSEGYHAFTRVAVVADTGEPTPPCGACRQTLWELGGDREVTLANPEAPKALYRMRDLLPLPFDARLPGG
jgi:hypothetical protein